MEGSPDSNQDGQSANVPTRPRTSRQASNVPPTAERQEAGLPTPEASTVAASHGTWEDMPVPPGTDSVNQTTEDDWPEPSESSPGDEGFVNAVVPEYEDSNEPGSAMGLPSLEPVLPTRPPPVLLELRWLPPRPPSSFDGFNIYVHRDGRDGGELRHPHILSFLSPSSAGHVTETASVDENTHEFFTELTEPGTYRVQVTALSSSGGCETRESRRTAGPAFYLGASQTWDTWSCAVLITSPLQVPAASCCRSCASVLGPSASACWTPARLPSPGRRHPSSTTAAWWRWCPPPA